MNPLVSIGVPIYNVESYIERCARSLFEQTYVHIEYIFIDDPVTSLDDNHLIQMSVNLSTVIRKSESGLKFIITTHRPLN